MQLSNGGKNYWPKRWIRFLNNRKLFSPCNIELIYQLHFLRNSKFGKKCTFLPPHGRLIYQILVKNVHFLRNLVAIFVKNVNLVPIFVKSVNLVKNVNGRWTHYKLRKFEAIYALMAGLMLSLLHLIHIFGQKWRSFLTMIIKNYW